MDSAGPRRPIFINGKFYAGGMNGVHRVADRLIAELDALLDAIDVSLRPRAVLLVPERRKWEPKLKAIEIQFEKRAHSQLWEQFILPHRAKGGVLVNLCNLAPLMHTRKLLMVHDAQFLFPDSSYPAMQRWGYSLLVPWMCRSSASVVTVSEYSRQMLDLFKVSKRNKTSVVHNGADHILSSAANLPDNLSDLVAGQYVVHFASHKAYKNTGVLIDAFRRPELRDLTLLCVGPAAAELGALAHALPSNIRFAGRVDDNVLRALYERALCVAMPSRTEGFGLPPVEAMACGCPAVVSPCGAMPEVCRDAVLYADVDNPSSWAAAFVALRGQQLRNEKIATGRERAASLTWRAAGRRLFDAITAIS